MEIALFFPLPFQGMEQEALQAVIGVIGGEAALSRYPLCMERNRTAASSSPER